MDTIILSAIAAAVLIIWLLIKYAAPSYIKEKFKNVATKEDIGEITKEIESVKAAFEKDKIKFSHYHQKQAEVIEEFYPLLRDCIKNLSDFCIHVIPIEDSSIPTPRTWVTDKIMKADDYLQKNRLFFDDNTNLELSKILSDLQRLNASFDGLQFSHDEHADKVKTWNKFYMEYMLQTVTKFGRISVELKETLTGNSESIQ